MGIFSAAFMSNRGNGLFEEGMQHKHFPFANAVAVAIRWLLCSISSVSDCIFAQFCLLPNLSDLQLTRSNLISNFDGNKEREYFPLCIRSDYHCRYSSSSLSSIDLWCCAFARIIFGGRDEETRKTFVVRALLASQRARRWRKLKIHFSIAPLPRRPSLDRDFRAANVKVYSRINKS